MTKEEVRELWELCGFKQIKDGDIQWPTGLIFYKYPLITLDNLFEWAVPLLDYWEMGRTGDGKTYAIARLKYADPGDTRILTIEDKPLDALAQACLKALREGKP